MNHFFVAMDAWADSLNWGLFGQVTVTLIVLGICARVVGQMLHEIEKSYPTPAQARRDHMQRIASVNDEDYQPFALDHPTDSAA